MKTRDPRRQVLINARIRTGVQWDDVRILNLSKRGMLVQAAEPPRRGSYFEVRRGRQAIVARVMWTAGTRFGALTQDPLNVDAIISEANGAAGDCEPPAESGPIAERRAVARPDSAERHEHSRWLARAIQFACLASFGLGVAVMLGDAIRQALVAPLTATSAALQRR